MYWSRTLVLRAVGGALAFVSLLGVLTPGTAMAQTLLHELEGEATFDFCGWSVSGAGDVDADGRDDVVVGSLGYSLGPRARVFSGRTGIELYAFSALSFSDASGAGDVDADGHADVIVGDTGGVAQGPWTGRADVYSGSTGATLHTFDGLAADDSFGTSVSCAGDVDADGFPDLVVGGHQPDTFNPGPGYARVYSGLNGSLLHHFVGDSPGDAFGFDVSGAGDVDADGYADVVIGAYRDDDNGNDSGSARVFSGRTGAVLHDIDGAAGEQLGRAVSGVGDVNRDGFDDFVAGAPGANQLAGSVRVHSGFDGSLLYSFDGASFGSLGAYVGAAGDVDGDCFPDVIAGAPNGNTYARVFSGRDGSVIYTVSGISFGPVSGAGDVNGDGLGDVVVGDPIVDVMGVPGHEVGRALVYSGLATPFPSYCGPAVPNSSGFSARIAATGSAVASDDCLHLYASNLPANQFGYFLASRTQGFVPGAGGSQGNLCVVGTVGRFNQQIQSSGPNGSFGIDVDLTSIPTSPPSTVMSGETWNFQAWFRDVNPNPTSNFTDGATATFQ